jgi:hypothetical protein
VSCWNIENRDVYDNLVRLWVVSNLRSDMKTIPGFHLYIPIHELFSEFDLH